MSAIADPAAVNPFQPIFHSLSRTRKYSHQIRCQNNDVERQHHKSGSRNKIAILALAVGFFLVRHIGPQKMNESAKSRSNCCGRQIAGMTDDKAMNLSISLFFNAMLIFQLTVDNLNPTHHRAAM